MGRPTICVTIGVSKHDNTVARRVWEHTNLHNSLFNHTLISVPDVDPAVVQ